MRCPHCGLAELNSGECPICHYEVGSSLVGRLGLKLKRLELAPSTRKLWALNLEFYARTKAMIFILGVMLLGIALALMLETMPLMTMGFAIYFGLMAFYEVFRLHKKKEAKKK